MLISELVQFIYLVNSHNNRKFSLAKYAQRRRQRRDTFTSADLLLPHGSHAIFPNSGGTRSSSPIPISHSLFQHSQHSSSQPAPTGYRRIYSPLANDTSNILHIEPSPRRYSASAAISPPKHHNLYVPPILNLIPPSPQQLITQDSLKKLIDRQWHIPILLYGCNKLRLASSLLLSNEQFLKYLSTDAYIDCTKDDNELINGTTTASTTTITAIQNVKPRKRGTVMKR
jgi:hypothetical protein